jgi:prevent-host-death family protein
MADMNERARVGIRELRQNLSIYIDRVKEGETLEVTEHGHPVAELHPIRPRSKSLYEQMVADGRITPATKPLSSLPPPIDLPAGAEPVSEILIRMRDDERY